MRNDPPQRNEVEVSLFGPGYGECVAVHIGDGLWVIIDSCIGLTGRCAPIEYLEQLGVDLRSSVIQIVATHWHDDHVRGLGELIDKCDSAQFVCSDALRNNEFLQLVNTYLRASEREESGVAEFGRVIKVLEKRSRNRASTYVGPKWAVAERTLLKRELTISGSPVAVALTALSPSDAAIMRAKLEIARLIPAPKDARAKVPSTSPNHASVVLHLSINNLAVLLGADLEEKGKATKGWSAILDSSTRPTTQSSVFKVPHHGSSTAEHPDTWSKLLVADVHAIMTPFVKGNVALPSKSDIARINSRTINAYVTCPPRRLTPVKRPNIVEKQVKEATRYIRPVLISDGHVRLRANILGSNQWRVELFNDALRLGDT